jgi:putative PIN family toxin of toxin-antitoxin system
MTAPIPGAVFDCVVLLQAAISRKGPAYACKALLDAGRVRVFVSPDVLAEITEVLNRPELQRKFQSLTREAAAAFLKDLGGKTVPVAHVPQQFSYARDPDDERYVNLALAVGAGFLVTWDNDLLDLMGDNPAGVDFRRRFPGLHILTPAAFLRALAAPPPAPAEGGGSAEPSPG